MVPEMPWQVATLFASLIFLTGFTLGYLSGWSMAFRHALDEAQRYMREELRKRDPPEVRVTRLGTEE